MDFISNEINRITAQGWAQETRGYVSGPEPRLGGLQHGLGSLTSPFHPWLPQTVPGAPCLLSDFPFWGLDWHFSVLLRLFFYTYILFYSIAKDNLASFLAPSKDVQAQTGMSSLMIELQFQRFGGGDQLGIHPLSHLTELAKLCGDTISPQFPHIILGELLPFHF